jgi:molybdopterin-guanine dinucleotide biosynthesis protein
MNKIMITVQGSSHSGKGTAIAAIAHKLRELGATVTVQGEQTHNKEKLEKADEELAPRLQDIEVMILEQRTSS